MLVEYPPNAGLEFLRAAVNPYCDAMRPFGRPMRSIQMIPSNVYHSLTNDFVKFPANSCPGAKKPNVFAPAQPSKVWQIR